MQDPASSYGFLSHGKHPVELLTVINDAVEQFSFSLCGHFLLSLSISCLVREAASLHIYRLSMELFLRRAAAAERVATADSDDYPYIHKKGLENWKLEKLGWLSFTTYTLLFHCLFLQSKV